MPTLCEAIGVEIPHGVQGRSLWPLLQGKDYPEEEFRSIYSGVGFGGLYYDESYPMPYRLAETPPKGANGEGPPTALWNIDELNPVTQSGTMKMVRMGDWKLIYDMMGYGQLYNLSSDPCELKNLFGDPSVATEQLRMVEELLMWTIRYQDTLPVDEPKKGLAVHSMVANSTTGTRLIAMARPRSPLFRSPFVEKKRSTRLNGGFIPP